MSRKFSSTARRLLEFIWKGATRDSKYEKIIEDQVGLNNRLKGAATKVEIQYEYAIVPIRRLTCVSGSAHKSRSDPETHVSGQIYGAHGRLTSVHAYEDGTVEYSQKKYNEAQE